MKTHIDKIFEDSGITRFSTTFGEIAQEEFEAQKTWLTITAVIGCIIVGLSAYSLVQIFSSAPLETILYKLPFVFSFLLISVWTGHKYSIARKNRITYRHLATTLATYNTFNDAIKGEEQKNLLLFEIAKVLFTPPISNQSENQKEMANTIDLIKTLASSNLLKGLNSSDDNKGKG